MSHQYCHDMISRIYEGLDEKLDTDSAKSRDWNGWFHENNLEATISKLFDCSQSNTKNGEKEWACLRFSVTVNAAKRQ